MSDFTRNSLFPTLPGMVPNSPFPIQVLDNRGNPIQSKPEKLTDEQSVSSMMSGYWSYLDSIMTLANFHPDALIAHKGWEYLYQMMTMGAVRTPINLKLQAALYKEGKVVTAVGKKEEEKEAGDYEKAQEAVDMCQHLIDNIYNPETGSFVPIRKILWNIGQAVPFGFSVNEMIWRYEDSGKYKGKRFLQNVVFRPNEQIGFDLDNLTGEVMQVTSTTPKTGREKRHIPIKKILLYTFNAIKGLPYGDGDLRSMAKHYFAMDNGLKWYGMAQKRWGQPFIEAILANVNNAPDRMRDLEFVLNGAPWAHSNQDEYKVHTLSAASLDSYQTFCAFHSMQMMQSVLGNTLTTSQGDGSSSFALGQTHSQSQNFFLAPPRHGMEATIQTMFRRCIEYNMGVQYLHLTPTYYLGHWDDAERKLIAEVYTLLAEMGVFDPREGWVRKEFNIPEMPEGFDPMDDSLPLLPGRERIQVDGTMPGQKPTPTTPTKPGDKKALFIQQRQEEIILRAAEIITNKHFAGLKKDIDTDVEIPEAA